VIELIIFGPPLRVNRNAHYNRIDAATILPAIADTSTE
jgi:hypothetical protein